MFVLKASPESGLDDTEVYREMLPPFWQQVITEVLLYR